jgi:hypothetical protein
VQPGWKEGEAAAIDKSTYQHHGGSLQRGTRLLIYVKEPVDAIVGEGEAAGAASQTEAQREEPDVVPANTASPDLPVANQSPEQALKSGGQSVDHRTYKLPYRVIRSKAETRQIPLTRVRTLIGSEFSVFDEEWIPLTEEQYNALIQEWERNTP